MFLVAASVLMATPVNFESIVASAHGGDTIVLSPGVYSTLRVSSVDFDPPVTIDAVKGTFAPVGDVAAMLITDSSGITVTGLTVAGDTSKAQGTGVRVNESRRVTITTSTFTGLKRGIVFQHVTKSRIQQVSFRAMTSDGIDLVGVSEIVIADLECSGSAARDGYHPDCIQLWTWKGAGPSSDISISRANISGATQGIFFTNNQQIGLRKVAISDVTIRTTMPQGILLYGCEDCLITKTSVGAAAGARFPVAVRIIGGSVARSHLSLDRLVLDGKLQK